MVCYLYIVRAYRCHIRTGNGHRLLVRIDPGTDRHTKEYGQLTENKKIIDQTNNIIQQSRGVGMTLACLHKKVAISVAIFCHDRYSPCIFWLRQGRISFLDCSPSAFQSINQSKPVTPRRRSGTPNRCLRCEGRPSTPVVRNAEQ